MPVEDKWDKGQSSGVYRYIKINFALASIVKYNFT